MSHLLPPAMVQHLAVQYLQIMAFPCLPPSPLSPSFPLPCPAPRSTIQIMTFPSLSLPHTEFRAIATTYVGNFTGQCMIQLNGQAIVILNNGVEINKWPYNCIRQFRAEDETGKFSFVSGRRGPYGVAEYNFKMNNDSLIDLQGALTEFTGAQFSAVAPGSGTDQQPLQPQQPLPPYPLTMPRPSVTSTSSSSSYMTSLPRRTTVGGRVDSTSSDSSVFNSPAHHLQHTTTPGPKLPPRDYMLMNAPPGSSPSSGGENTPPKLSSSADETMLRGVRSRTSTSSLSVVDSGSYSVPRPALPPPRREVREPSPEAWVAKSTSYEETQVTGQQASGRAEKPAPPPPAVPRKRSLFDRLRGSGGPDSKSEGAETKR